MTSKEQNDLFYVCSLIEYISRETNNTRGTVVNAMGIDGVKKQLYDAEVNHCLSFEQVSDELIAQYEISNGDFDTITNCKYSIPSYLDIGRLYSTMVLDCAKEGEEIKELIQILNSFISDEISDFKTGIYYQNHDYLEHSYHEGRLLD